MPSIDIEQNRSAVQRFYQCLLVLLNTVAYIRQDPDDLISRMIFVRISNNHILKQSKRNQNNISYRYEFFCYLLFGTVISYTVEDV
jgi:hypothetical protein